MEENKDNGNGKVPEQPKDLILAIKLSHESGQLSVQAPGNGTLFDEPMSLWMLEKAKNFIMSNNARAMQSKIVKPQSGFTNRLRGAFGGRNN